MPCIAKTYAPIGETPEIACDSKNKEFISISGVISPDGYSYFEIREKEGFKQQGLLRFIDNVVADCREKIAIIWDNASSHTSKTVKKYLKNQNQENPIVWLSNIPPYSPELNPIEQVWGYLKKKLANQFVKTTIDATVQNFKAFNDNINAFAELNKNTIQSWINPITQKN